SWFEGRATEARPSWGYALSMAGRLTEATAVLDVQTGGGEVLDFALQKGGSERRPPLVVATEGWAPNVAKATRLLRPRGVPVV
ncbi:SAM-dependent methyltransferase, partial [Streptomyces sp. NPDC057074]